MGFTIALNVALWILLLLWLRRLIVRRLAPERILRDLREEVADLVREINRVGDQNTTLVEDRVSTLKSIVGQAENLIDEGQLLLRRLEERTDLDQPQPSAHPEIKHEGDAPRDKVGRLHRQGMSSDMIASHLGIAIGEVELMIALMEQQQR